MNKATTTNCHGTYQNGGPSSGNALTRDLQKDVLDTFHQFSNDEVLTPPWLAEQMLDALPKEVWCNPDLKWLDIACKSGVFLREASLRLKAEFTRRAKSGNPVVTAGGKKLVTEAQIVDHILGEMLYGVAVTNLMAKVSRRVLYSSVDATHPTNSAARRIKHFGPDGNIRFVRASHNYNTGGSCKVCGYSEEFENAIKEGASGEGSGDYENYAYELIHPTQDSSTEDETNEEEATKALFKDPEGETVKFDVIIGNPPYHMTDSSDSPSAKPLYNKFVEVAKQLNPKYITMIIPARWYARGKGLDQFRATMIADRDLKGIVDYPNEKEVFPEVEGIPGGVMYFLREQGHQGDCGWVTVKDGEISPRRELDLRSGGAVIYRDEFAHSIMEKVQAVNADGNWMASDDKGVELEVKRSKPFGLRTFVTGKKQQGKGDIALHQSDKVALSKKTWIQREKITKNDSWVDMHKVLVSGANGGALLSGAIISEPFHAGKGSACTETFLVAGLFKTKAEADRRIAYMKTKFFRYLVSLRKLTQHNPAFVFACVPAVDNSVVWTDATLYEHFGLSVEEIEHIETTIKAMP